MKTESNIKPKKIVIEKTINGMCDVVICTNINQTIRTIEETDETIYKYDIYRIPLVWRDGLEKLISDNFEDWVSYGIEIENKPKELSDKEKLMFLMKENSDLKKTNEALKADNELLKGCIIEIANEVFA